MATRLRWLLVASMVVVGACRDEPAAAPPVASTSSTTAPTTTTTAAPITTTTEPAVAWPSVPDPGAPARAVVTPTGVVLAVLATNADGSFLARSPCGAEVTVAGQALTGAHVVLDPGHGGDEPGAVGPGGTIEKAVNLAVAQEAARRLEARGAIVVLTRTSDYRITLASRAAIATTLQPQLFISIHHNAAPDGPRDGPGAETYFQISSPGSKRAAGLVYEELVAAFRAYDVAWVADRDAGAKYRPRSDGGDYYGILRRSAGVPAVLAEAAFISNPPEEALLADPAFQAVEAQAIVDAVVRYVGTADPG
ncbi:MAG: N-acetylmuramoyl-L-alanine amidase, partial [Acidimicrobiales bacterium]